MEENKTITSFGSQAFWDQNRAYMFNSTWQGLDDLLALYGKKFSKDERFLHIGCGPGDIIIKAAEYIENGIAHGIDYSENSLEFINEKMENYSLVLQVMYWGRILSMWYLEEISSDELIDFMHALGNAEITLDEIKDFYANFNYIKEHYPILSPYGYLYTALQKHNFIFPDTDNFKKFETLCREHFSDSEIEKIGSRFEKVDQKRDLITYQKMDAFSLDFPDNSFSKVLIFEIEPILSTRGSGWVDEAVRVCEPEGLILFCGVRVPEELEEIKEIESFKRGISGFSVHIVNEGKKVLHSAWDPGFNNPTFTEYIHTPYILCEKIKAEDFVHIDTFTSQLPAEWKIVEDTTVREKMKFSSMKFTTRELILNTSTTSISELGFGGISIVTFPPKISAAKFGKGTIYKTAENIIKAKPDFMKYDKPLITEETINNLNVTRISVQLYVFPGKNVLATALIYFIDNKALIAYGGMEETTETIFQLLLKACG